MYPYFLYMNKLVSLLAIILLFLCVSCSSVDSDAKRAAELNLKSIEYIKEQDLQEAEKLYKESQEIVNKYKNTENSKEFYAAYNKYLSGDDTNK